MKEDDVVESFFKRMKEADENLVVPVFPEKSRPERRRHRLAFFYAAATLAAVVMAVVFWVQGNRNQAQKDELFILTDEEINSLIEGESMSEWDSPTKFLAEDF